MAALFREQQLCDVAVSVGGAPATRAHAAVLASISEYFRRALVGERKPAREIKVDFPHATPALVAAAVESIYTGKLSVGQHELVAMAHVLARLGITPMQTACVKKLVQGSVWRQISKNGSGEGLAGFAEWSGMHPEALGPLFKGLGK